MDHERALAILKTLSDGIDPATGETFPADSPYQQPDAIRALLYAVQALGQPPAPAGKLATARPAPGNAGKPWTREEDERLVAGFDAGQSPEALAAAHGRSRIAIEARLARFGKMPMPAGVRGATPRAEEAPMAPYAARPRATAAGVRT